MSADYRTAKLADFGLARPLVRRAAPAAANGAPTAGSAAAPAPAGAEPAPEEGCMTPRIGPRKYRAPEVEAAKPYGAMRRRDAVMPL